MASEKNTAKNSDQYTKGGEFKNQQQEGPVIEQFSHDLNNLLIGIQGYARLLKSEGHVTEGGDYYMNQLLKISDKAANRSKQLQRFFKSGDNIIERRSSTVSKGKKYKKSSKVKSRSRILVIDDEAAVRELLMKSLTMEGFEVVTAADGLEGIDKFQSAEFDCVLLDLSMPYMSGNLVFARLKAIDRSVPVILISSYLSADREREFSEIGVFDFIEKPFQGYALLDSVRRACKKSRGESTQRAELSPH